MKKLVFTAALLVASNLMVAQQTGSPDTNGQPTAVATSDANLDGTTPDAQASMVVSQPASEGPGYWVPDIKRVGSAESLTNVVGVTHIGPIRLQSLSFTQVYDDSDFNGVTARRNVSVGRASLGFDRQFGRSRLALQYQPKMTIDNGGFQSDPMNQDVSFDTYYVVSPKWVLGISDHFSYVNTHNLIGDSYLSVDSISGSSLQGNFIQGPSSFLNNTASVSLTHSLSANTRLTFTPSYTYSNVQGAAVTDPVNHIYNFATSFDQTLSAANAYSLFWSIQTIRNSRSLSGTIYQTMGVSYRHAFSPTFVMSGSGGASTNSVNSNRMWTATGELTAAKTFGHSSVAMAITRSQAYASYIYVGGYTTRADLQYSRQLSQRWNLTGAYGYQLSDSTLGSSLTGNYVRAEMNYSLTRSVSWSMGGAQLFQSGDGHQFTHARRMLLTFGLVWSFGGRPGL